MSIKFNPNVGFFAYLQTDNIIYSGAVASPTVPTPLPMSSLDKVSTQAVYENVDGILIPRAAPTTTPAAHPRRSLINSVAEAKTSSITNIDSINPATGGAAQSLDKNKGKGFNWFQSLDINHLADPAPSDEILDKKANATNSRGRPCKLTPDEAKALNREILRLQNEGTSNAVIKRLLAIQFGISEKSVGRATQKLIQTNEF